MVFVNPVTYVLVHFLYHYIDSSAFLEISGRGLPSHPPKLATVLTKAVSLGIG